MANVMKSVGATLAGLLVAMLIIAVVEGVSSFIYPAPADLDMTDPEQMAKFVESLPLGAFLFVLVAWGSGSLAGTYLARRLAPERKSLPAAIVIGLLLFATVANLLMIPHPLWFSICGVLVVLIFGLLGAALCGGTSVAQTQRTIDAPLERVFATLATIDEFSKAVPGITKVEFLTEQKYGVGTKFRETRLMNGKEVDTELEVAELDENRRIRMVSDAGGTIWDTVFLTEALGDGAVLMSMKMDARPYKIFSKVITPLVMVMVRKAVEDDMDSVKAHCESNR